VVLLNEEKMLSSSFSNFRLEDECCLFLAEDDFVFCAFADINTEKSKSNKKNIWFIRKI
jgi:hypothetical protein